MQTERGMQLILLGGPPLKSEALMGLSIDGVSRTREVVLAPVVGQHQHERCKQGQSPPVALYVLQYLFFAFFFYIYSESKRDINVKSI